MAAQLMLLDLAGKPVHPFKIDEDMCHFFQVDVHPTKWYRGWMDSIGFSLAVGKSFAETMEIWPEHRDILEYLELNYTNDSYYTR